jgi:GNAT superfamily N-acetyltransferase
MSKNGSSNSFLTRQMTVEDMPQVARLCGQLGFETSETELVDRFAAIHAHRGHVAFVAESAGAIVGWVHAYLAPSLLSEATTEIGGMVVNDANRRKGVGSALMREAEAWALEHGCTSMLLATRTQRQGAKDFYESLGFAAEFTTYFMRKAAGYSPRRRLNSATT